jgi:hypothetical protein
MCSVQLGISSQFAWLNVTLKENLLDGPILQGLLGSNTIPELGRDSPVGNRLLLSHSSTAFQQSACNQFRAFPSQIFLAVV